MLYRALVRPFESVYYEAKPSCHCARKDSSGPRSSELRLRPIEIFSLPSLDCRL